MFGGTGGGTLDTPEAAADDFLMVAVTSWEDLSPTEAEDEAARGDRMGKPLSLPTEESSFCCGGNNSSVKAHM